jgi:hypothetical protein
MSLTTPSKIRELQSKLYRKAKNEFPVQSRSTRHFSDEVVFGNAKSRGFEMSNGTLVRESTVKPVGKPDAGNPHVRFDERGWETGRASASVLAPILDSTNWPERRHRR